MAKGKPQNPQLIRSHPLAAGIKGAYLFGVPYWGRYVIDYAYGQHLINGNVGLTFPETRTKITGSTIWFDSDDWMYGSDRALPSGASPFTIVYRGFPNQASVGCVFGYGTSGTVGAFRAFRFNAANIEMLGWGADLVAPHGLGATPNRLVLYAATYDGTNARFYSKIENQPFGQIGSTTPLALNLIKHATAGIQVGISQFSGGDRHSGYFDLLYIYSRTLSASELNVLSVDPYQMFASTALPRIDAVGSIPTAGGGGNGGGGGSGTGTGTGKHWLARKRRRDNLARQFS